MVSKIGAKEFKERIIAKLQNVNSDIEKEDFYFTQTCTGYYLEYNTQYPEHGNECFIVSQDLNGSISVTGNVNALIPTIRHFENIDDFERNL